MRTMEKILKSYLKMVFIKCVLSIDVLICSKLDLVSCRDFASFIWWAMMEFLIGHDDIHENSSLNTVLYHEEEFEDMEIGII